jgi:hypothetical protein
MRTLILLPALALTACPGSPPTPAVVAGVASTWKDQSVSGGVPRSQYRFAVSGTALTGETYFRDVGKRMGSLTGTLSADGSAQWTTALTDNDSACTEAVVGKFIGNGFSGTFTIRNPDGSLRQQETQGLERVAGSGLHPVVPAGAHGGADKRPR